MSLDFYLEAEKPLPVDGAPRIYIRADGQMQKVSREVWELFNPGCEPVAICEYTESRIIYEANITHNLITMANAAGLYDVLWRPNENGVRVASEAGSLLEDGIRRLNADPDYFRQFNPKNGWGDYDGLLRFARGVLAACREHPAASVRVWV